MSYRRLRIGSPSLPDVNAPGKTLKAQAINMNYQDLYRNLQVDREEEYQKELKDGQLTPEFGNLNLESPMVKVGVLAATFFAGYMFGKRSLTW